MTLKTILRKLIKRGWNDTTLQLGLVMTNYFENLMDEKLVRDFHNHGYLFRLLYGTDSVIVVLGLPWRP